jgi:lysine 2,3-aminomutase
MNWRKEYNKNITNLADLCNYVKCSPQEYSLLSKVVERHPMSISRHYLSLIDFNDPDDPIKKMIVPSVGELDIHGSYDTSGERLNTKFLGFQHKYDQTALILSTSRCASYCRFCFRKRMVGRNDDEVVRNFKKAVNYIKLHKEINNVLISGGDPLMLQTRVIRRMLSELTMIEHLDFIRIGSKVPVFIPNRILHDKELTETFKKYSRSNKKIYLVLHIDHPREITPELVKAVVQLLNSNIIISNQTVLLKGVNDDPDVMAELQNKLVSIGVNPYYVFQCRPVKRVKSNFQVSLYDGYNIIEKAKTKLNGHSKRFRYVMSHIRGKIEILGYDEKYMFFKYHQAKSPNNAGRLFKRKLDRNAKWLNEFSKEEEIDA